MLNFYKVFPNEHTQVNLASGRERRVQCVYQEGDNDGLPAETIHNGTTQMQSAFNTENIQTLLNEDGVLFLVGKCESEEQINALGLFLESNMTIPGWNGVIE